MFAAVQIAYWLALSTWFGGVLFVAVAAPVVFRIVRDADPTLPKVLSVNLDGQHAMLLAGSIIGEILATLTRVQLICAGVLAAALIGQWVLTLPTGANLIAPLLRTLLFLAAAALLIYEWRFIWPRVVEHRQTYIDHADEPDIANPAKDQFDAAHQESVVVLRNMLFLLLGVILFSVDVRPAMVIRSSTIAPAHASQGQ